MDRLSHAVNHMPKRRGARAGLIYFIQCHDFVKVGFTDKLDLRLAALQTGCPYELDVIHTIASKDMQEDERRVHKHWKRYEVRGEWFRVPDCELTTLSASWSVDELLEK